MKKFLSAAILTAMLLGIAGCGGNTDSSSQTESSSGGNAETVSSGEPAAADDGEVVSLEVFSLPSNTSGLWEGWAADIIREKVGVELEVLAAGDQGEQKLQALMASGELPDLVVFKENTQVINAVAGDMLLAYDDYQEYVPHIYENANASLRYYADYVSDGNGKAYSVGSTILTEPITKGNLNFGPVLRYDLYKEIGAPTIETWEDYLPVLKQMQDLYPTTEDGQKVYGLSLWQDWDRAHLMLGGSIGNLNGINIPNEAALVEIDHTQNNKVSSLLAEDSWYLKTIHFFYEANQMGLLDPDSMTQRFDDAQAKYTAGRVLFSLWPWGVGSFNNQENLNNGIGFMPVMAQNAKILYADIRPTGQAWSWSVSKATEYPEKAMAFVDAMYDPEVLMEMNNGPKGVVWDLDENNNPYVLENGMQYLLDTTLDLPGGNNLAKGTSGNMFNANGLSPNYRVKEYNDNPLSYGGWSTYTPNYTKLELEWQEDWGTETQVEYLTQRDGIVVAPFVNYPVFTDEMEQISARVGDVVKTLSWQMVFAADDVSPSRKKGHEKARKNGMNHRNAEGCSLTLPGRSSVFQIAREKVLPKRSEAAACCKMLPCKRRRPPEQRRVSGTASGE